MIGVAVVVVMCSLGALALLDRGHGGFGGDISRAEVRTELIVTSGTLTHPSLPEGLIIMGAGRRTELTFEVENRDPDNDIDTIFVTVPGANIISGSYKWPDGGTLHEWDWLKTATDSVRFTAKDDLPGRVVGGSSQYDVAGNVDDALDMVDGKGESVTVSVVLQAPSTPGMRTDHQGISLEVADLKTEEPGSPKTLIDPYPVPYAVVKNGTRLLLLVLRDAPDCELEVIYGDNHLFAPTSRGPPYTSSERGYRSRTPDGSSAVLLEAPPSNVAVKPLVRALRDGLVGELTLDISVMYFPDITSGVPTMERLVEGYREGLPASSSKPLDLDMDSDGVLNLLDDDMDGDGIPNDEDPLPRVRDKRPVVLGTLSDISVKEGRPVTVTVRAYDPEDRSLNHTWTISTDASWTAYGSTVTTSPLKPGLHVLTVVISDPAGNWEELTINITVHENRAPVITKAAADRERIKEGEPVTLYGAATDPDGDSTSFGWTRDEAPSWRADGATVTVYDLPKGTYKFTLHASDGELESIMQVAIKVEGEGAPFPWEVIFIAAVALSVITALIVILTRRRGTAEERGDAPPIENGDVAKERLEAAHNEGPDLPPRPDDDGAWDKEPEEDDGDEEEPEGTDDGPWEPCPGCGAGLGPGDTRCPSCGATFEEVYSCSNCGFELEDMMTVCPGCGERLQR